MTRVGFLGAGTATEAARAALADTNADGVPVDPDALDSVDFAVAVAPIDGDGIRTVTAAARRAGTPIVTIELGGIGGRAVTGVDAAATGFASGTACYDCLRRRIAAVGAETDDGETDPATARLAGAIAGREIVDLLAGGESPLLGGVFEVPYSQRRLLPVPGCSCDDAPDYGLRRDSGGRSLDDALGAAEIALDDRLGPISTVGEVESFPVAYYLATLASTPFSDADVPDHSAGVAADWDPAFMKALGEALERYGAAVYRTADLIEDPEAPVAPSRFVTPEEYGDGEPSLWHPAENLETGMDVELPAELVVFPPPERTIRPSITTGLGLGNDGVEALLSGLYEVIERDAAMIAWYSSYEPLELAVDADGYRTLRRRIRSEGLDATALLLTQDVDVPVVAVCVHRKGEWPQFAAGLAADLDPSAATIGAFEEAIQNWLELRRMGPEVAAEESGAIGPYAEFPEAAREFVDAPTTVPASSVGPDEVPTGEGELRALVDRLAAVDLDAYGARLTPRDVESLGFEAVRAVVPAAQPLFTSDPYFGERAQTVPEELGDEPRFDRAFHPFP